MRERVRGRGWESHSKAQNVVGYGLLSISKASHIRRCFTPLRLGGSWTLQLHVPPCPLHPPPLLYPICAAAGPFFSGGDSSRGGKTRVLGYKLTTRGKQRRKRDLVFSPFRPPPLDASGRSSSVVFVRLVHDSGHLGYAALPLPPLLALSDS